MEIRRFLAQATEGGGAEVRAVDSAGVKRLSGYALKYNQLSVPLPDRQGRPFREKIERGSISNLDSDILILYNHDLGQLLGRTSAGTLVLRDDPVGLAFSVDLPDTQLGRDTWALVKRGDLKGMSFAFNIPSGGQTWDVSTTPPTRTITSMRVSEVSIVATPAYEQTEVKMRFNIPAESSVARERWERLDLVFKQLEQERVEDEIWREQHRGRRYDYDAT